MTLIKNRHEEGLPLDANLNKIVKNEKLSDEDKKEIERLRNDLKKLMEGGSVGK